VGIVLTLLGLLALTLAPALAMAEEPAGLNGFAFGTRRSALMEPLFRGRCRPASDTSGPRLQGPRVTCANYALKDIGQVTVALLFSPEDRFVGYVVYLPENEYQSARARILSRYGPPTRTWEDGRTIAWAWPSGTQASMTDLCVGKQGCLTVKSKGAADPMAPK
jgi:hypothetical protein